MLANKDHRTGGDGRWFRRASKPLYATKTMFRSSLGVVGKYRRAYLLLNLAYYGLMVAAMAYAAFHPGLQRTLLEAMGEAVGTGPMQTVAGAYLGDHLLLAAVLTFAVNLIGGSFVYITLPSIIVPFSGLLPGAFRALLWGLMFSPTAVIGAGFYLLLPTIILEGQGYVLAMLAAYAQGMAFVRPKSVGEKTHRAGYWEGVKSSARIYLLVAIVLFVAAVYEAASVIFIM
jgi:hypothetical protein